MAQAVYKSIMPDGKVIYGEKPVPGAAKVDKVETPPPKSGITVVTPEEKARVEKLAKEREKASAASAGKKDLLDDARKQLQKAESDRDSGQEPLPGERLGTGGGKSRLSDDYFARQKKLEQAVVDARKRLDELERGGR